MQEMRVLCAMSGGVDSSVSALLLREAGHQVIGVFLRLGAHADAPSGPEGKANRRGCCSVEDSRDAALVANRLGIPFYALNSRGEFSRIIDYFVEEYHRGRTPNPCIRCNQWLKFGTLLDRARALDCEALATGHYARIREDPRGEPQLLRAADPEKDQSYFLFSISREALRHTVFPVGHLNKPQVRDLARREGLPVAEKFDSQEICFVPGDYRDVLRARGAGRIRPGPLVDTRGNRLGEHAGHQHFTIGQRRGLKVALGEPRYVVAIDPELNRVVLGTREELETRILDVDEVQWSSIPDPRPGDVLEAQVQIRHRHRARPARIRVESPGKVQVEFQEPQFGVTPGQAAVFYDGEVLLGGGWIKKGHGR